MLKIIGSRPNFRAGIPMSRMYGWDMNPADVCAVYPLGIPQQTSLLEGLKWATRKEPFVSGPRTGNALVLADQSQVEASVAEVQRQRRRAGVHHAIEIFGASLPKIDIPSFQIWKGCWNCGGNEGKNTPCPCGTHLHVLVGVPSILFYSWEREMWDVARRGEWGIVVNPHWRWGVSSNPNIPSLEMFDLVPDWTQGIRIED